jgi:hypothetical protein
MLHYFNRLSINAIKKKIEKFFVTFTILSFISGNIVYSTLYFLNFKIIKKFVNKVIYFKSITLT